MLTKSTPKEKAMSMQAPETSNYPVCHFIYTDIQSFTISARTYSANLKDFTKKAVKLENHPDIKANYEMGFNAPYLLLANSPNNIIKVETKVISESGVVPADVGTVPFSMMIVDTIDPPHLIEGIIRDLARAAHQLHTTNPNAKFILIGLHDDEYKQYKALGQVDKYPHRSISEQRLEQLAQQFKQYGCIGATEINMDGKLHHEAFAETSMHRFYRQICCDYVHHYYQQMQQAQAATHIAQRGLGGIMQPGQVQAGGVAGGQYNQVSAPVVSHVNSSQYNSSSNNNI